MQARNALLLATEYSCKSLQRTCSALQLSQKNLFFLVRVSVLLKFLRHADTDEFCSTSRDKSINGSSRLLTYNVRFDMALQEYNDPKVVRTTILIT